MANPSPLHVLLAGLVLLALYSVPLFSTVLPPLFDYPNHLARFAVLAAGGNQFYELRWAPLPNLAGDIIVPLLARAMPLALAGKLFLVMIFALILGGTAWLNRIVSGKWRFWPLLAAAFLYNLQLRWGFLNYLFGLGIALCGAALWLALEPARIWLRVGASAGVALLCYFSHISAFGVYALIVAGLEMQPGFAEWRGGRWRALRRRAEILVAQLAVPAVIAVAFWHPAGQSHIVYEGWSRKLEWLFGIFYNYDPLLDFGCFFLLLALLGTFAVFRRLNVAPRLVPAILLVLLAYLLLPTEMFGAWATDQRVILAFFLLLVAGTAPHFPSRRTAVLTGTAVVIVLLVRLGVVEAVWLKADPIYRADLAGLDMLPHGAKLAVAYPESALGTEQIPEVHVPTLAAARRNAFVPTLFTFPGQQPIVFRPPYDRLAAEAFQFTLWAAFMGGDDEARRQTLASLAGYDAIVFVNHEPFQLPREDCLKPLFRRPTFQIFTLQHGAGCPEPR
jgi:hypothetical protein